MMVNSARKHRLLAHTGPVVGLGVFVMLLLGGCNALKRGDFHRATEDSAYFREIGFKMADNPSLTRDAVVYMAGTSHDIYITVPYGADTVGGLNLSYKTIGEDFVVGTWTGPGNGDIAALTTMSFNSGTSPVSRSIRVYKQDPTTGEESWEDFTIHVNKILRTVLLTPAYGNIPSPLHLRFGIADENGMPIPNPELGTWYDEFTVPPRYDGGRITIEPATYPPAYVADTTPPAHYTAANPAITTIPQGFEIQVWPLFPNEHDLFFPSGVYSDQNGYFTVGSDHYEGDPYTPGTQHTLTYDPPAMHLAWWGNDSNAGTNPATPVQTWTEAQTKAQAAGILDIYVANTPNPDNASQCYDLAGNGIMDGSGAYPYFNIYGSWRTDFSSRYIDGGLGPDAYPQTVFYDSTQVSSALNTDPSAVLTYSGGAPYPPFPELVLDDVLIVVDSSTEPDLNFSTALKIHNGANPRVNRVQAFASQGSGNTNTAMTVANGASPNILESRFFGHPVAATTNRAIYANGASLNLIGCAAIAGESTGAGNASIGIDAEAGAVLNIDNSWVTAGMFFTNGLVNAVTEVDSFGIRTASSELNLYNSWVHAEAATGSSEAVRLINAIPSRIIGSALVSGQAGLSSALHSIGGGVDLQMFNSVLLADASTAGNAAGIRTEQMANSRIMNNVIHVKEGPAPDQSYGIHLSGAAPSAVDIRNNLVFSTRTGAFRGIYSDPALDHTGLAIRHNDFWDTDGNAELILSSFDGAQSLAYYHAAYPSIIGNIGMPLGIDTGFSYAADDFDVGRITSAIPTDVRMGGEDLSGNWANIAEYPEDGGPFDKRDREWTYRTGDYGAGWTMGAYEYDSGYLPSTVHVSPSGDDGNPLGTVERPFATLARAFDATRQGFVLPARYSATAIRVAAGSYDVGASGTGLPQFNDNISITGGWNATFSSRNPRTSILFKNDAGAMVDISNAAVGTGFVFDGFFLESRSGNQMGLLVQDFASPLIRNCTIASDGSVISSWMGISVDTDASPAIEDCIVDGASPTTGDTTAVRISGNANPAIRNSTINAGDSPPGGWTSNAIYAEAGATPTIEANVIRGGQADMTYAVNLQNAGSASLYGNDIVLGDGQFVSTGVFASATPVFMVGNTIGGGDASGGSTYGVDLMNSGGSNLFDNDIAPGSATNTSYGVRVDSGWAAMDSNRITAGPSSFGSWGVSLNLADNTVLKRNRILGGSSTSMTTGVRSTISPGTSITENSIFGGTASTDSIGLHLLNPDNTLVINNIVHGGYGVIADIRGIQVENSTNATELYSNTVFAGRSSGGQSVAVYNTSGAIQLINNILVAGTGAAAADSVGYWQGDAGLPARYLNNLILGMDAGGTAYLNGGTPFYTAAEIDTHFGGPSVSYDTHRVSLGENPAVYFRTFTATGGETAFQSDNWRLSGGGSENATAGGYDLSGFFDWDRDNLTRTVPWSIGAYEY